MMGHLASARLSSLPASRLHPYCLPEDVGISISNNKNCGAFIKWEQEIITIWKRTCAGEIVY